MAKSVPATRDHGSASNVESRERATAARTPTRRKVASRRGVGREIGRQLIARHFRDDGKTRQLRPGDIP